MTVVSNVNDTDIYHDASVYEEVLAPNDDFRRALSVEEFRDRLTVVLDRIDKKYENNLICYIGNK
jgi:hypothetical protein